MSTANLNLVYFPWTGLYAPSTLAPGTTYTGGTIAGAAYSGGTIAGGAYPGGTLASAYGGTTTIAGGAYTPGTISGGSYSPSNAAYTGGTVAGTTYTPGTITTGAAYTPGSIAGGFTTVSAGNYSSAPAYGSLAIETACHLELGDQLGKDRPEPGSSEAQQKQNQGKSSPIRIKMSKAYSLPLMEIPVENPSFHPC